MNINVQIVFEAPDIEAGTAEVATWQLTPGATIVGLMGTDTVHGTVAMPAVVGDDGSVTFEEPPAPPDPEA